MANQELIARLRITPCGTLFDPVKRTIELQRNGDEYRLDVFEQNLLTKKKFRRSKSIDGVAVQDRLVGLKNASVPAFPISPLVCDGEYVELMINGESASLTLGWWTIPPEGAERLGEFADWMRNTSLGRDGEPLREFQFGHTINW